MSTHSTIGQASSSNGVSIEGATPRKRFLRSRSRNKKHLTHEERVEVMRGRIDDSKELLAKVKRPKSPPKRDGNGENRSIDKRNALQLDPEVFEQQIDWAVREKYIADIKDSARFAPKKKTIKQKYERTRVRHGRDLLDGDDDGTASSPTMSPRGDRSVGFSATSLMDSLPSSQDISDLWSSVYHSLDHTTSLHTH